GVIAAALAVVTQHAPFVRIPLDGLDETLYDAFYQFRRPEDRTGGPVIIVTADERSIAAIAARHHYWPWPRDYWGKIVTYLQGCRVRAVVFDILFADPSVYGPFTDDDKRFADVLDRVTVPVVFATAEHDGKAGPFGVPVTREPLLGAANILVDKTI